MTEPAAPLCDSHLHLHDLLPRQADCLDRIARERRRVVSSCHSQVEVTALAGCLAAKPELRQLVAYSFGIHPQLPVRDEWEFLQGLVEAAAPGPRAGSHARLVAIGECGFDFFRGREPEGPRGESVQEAIFLDQAHLALRAGLPLVVHIRRATDLIFRHQALLKRLPAVVFHAWPAPPEEGLALLRHGVNAWFSLGTPLVQGNKKAIRSLLQLPPERLLMETDAPYQTLKGRAYTGTGELEEVYAEAARLRGMGMEAWRQQVAGNFARAYASPGWTSLASTS